MALLKVLGASPSGKRLERIQRSAHYKDGAFRNLRPTAMMVQNTSFFKMLIDFFNKPKTTSPAPGVVLPSVKTNLKSLHADVPTIVWFGHSSYFIRYRELSILVDPVLSGNASPFSFLVKSYPGTDIYKADDFPDIDIVIITHDHYDHLDYKMIKQLAPRVKMFCTSLGVGAHLEYWGVAPEKIVEFDWWEEKNLGENIRLTALPARHFSGRTFHRNQTLWSAFALQLDDYKLFLGGDSGYDTHFADIGKKFGGFDIALLEIGQYGKNWPYIHTTPEESVQAAVDLQTKVLMPVHWGKFTLAMHDWDEPIKRAMAAAQQKGLAVVVPKIGEPVVLGNYHPPAQWWNL